LALLAKVFCLKGKGFRPGEWKNKTLVASQPHREIDQNRSEDCQTQQIRHIPDG